MRIGVIGAASIFREKWLKVFLEHPKVDLVGVARREIEIEEKNFKQRLGYFSFSKEEVDWVYVPLPNSLHFDVAKHYLSLGINVLIEKPSAVTLKETETLLAIAKLNKSHLIEAFQWRFHKRTKWLMQNLDDINPYLIDVVFTIPHLAKDNIRYQKSLMGGAVYDLGAYPCSVLSTLYPKKNFELINFDVWFNNEGIDIGGCGAFKSNDLRLNFYYSFGKAYESRLTLHGRRGRYDLNQPFTSPSDKRVEITREFNTMISRETFIDCHFKSLAEHLVRLTKCSDFENEEVSIQAMYLNKLTFAL